MDKKTLLTQTRQLVSDGELTKAIDLAESFLNEDPRYKVLYREALRLSSLDAKTRKDEEKGIVNFENAKLNYNQVSNSFLNLLDFVETDNFNPPGLAEMSPGKSWKSSKWVLITIPVVLIGALMIALKFFGGEKEAVCPEFDNQAEFKAMVLPFLLISGGDSKPHALIVERLQEICAINNISSSIKIDKGFKQEENLLNYDEAGDLGKKCNATMVIWGRSEEKGGNNIIKTRYKYIGQKDGFAFKQIQWQGEKQIDTIKTLSSIASEGDLTAGIEEVIQLLAGVAASETGKIQAAISTLEGLETKDSTAILLKNMVLADNYLETKQPEKASAAYNSLLEVHPDYWLARNNRGMLRMGAGDYLGAVEDFSNALQKRAEDPEILIARGKAYQESDQLNKAKADYENAVKIQPEKKTTVEKPLKQVDSAIKREESVIKNITDETVAKPTKQNLWDLSEANKKLGNTRKASKLLEKGILLDPQDPRFYASKIELALKENKPKEVATLYREAQERGIKKEELFRIKPAIKEYYERRLTLEKQ